MNQIVQELWPYFLTALLPLLLGGGAAVAKAISNLRTDLKLTEQKVKELTSNFNRLEARYNHKSQQYDELKEELADFKGDLMEIKGDIKVLATKLEPTLELLRSGIKNI
jgi:archaellum component FlaC